MAVAGIATAAAAVVVVAAAADATVGAAGTTDKEENGHTRMCNRGLCVIRCTPRLHIR
jgi:hypothetical protein